MTDDLKEKYFGHKHRTVIKPPGSWLSINFREIWAYRELLSILAWKDVSILYKQSIVGKRNTKLDLVYPHGFRLIECINYFE